MEVGLPDSSFFLKRCKSVDFKQLIEYVEILENLLNRFMVSCRDICGFCRESKISSV